MAKLFNLQSMFELDDLQPDFDAALAVAVKDCVARSGIAKSREVSIVVKLVPKRELNGDCNDVIVDVQVSGKTPARQMQIYTMRTTVNDGLKYEPESPDNPDQPGLDFK